MLIPMKLSFLLLAIAPSALAQSTPCVMSLDYIQVVERDRKAGDFQTYELCANRPLQSSPTTPFQIKKPNIHIICKNCVIANSQLEIIGNSGADLDNVILEGVTFRSSSIYVRAKGSVAVVGCRFEQDSTLTALSTTTMSRSGASAPPPLTIRITRSIFLNNALSHDGTKGLLNFDNTYVNIQDSIFAGTTASNAQTGRHIIRVENGVASFEDNCFIDNDPTITPILTSSASNSISGNFWQQKNPGIIVPVTGCSFLASGDSLDGPFLCSTPISRLTCNAASLSNATSKLLPCESTLSDIERNEKGLLNDGTARTYLLCSGKTYSMTEKPLVISRPNVRVLCGADGKSRNNCRLVGGDVQLQIGTQDKEAPSSPLQNLLVMGLTLTESQGANIMVTESEGSLTIQNCIFMNNRNSAAIQIDASDESSLGMHVTVSKSAFAANRMGTKRGASTGVIVNKGGSLMVSESNFLGNKDSWIDHRYTNYLVGNIDGRLEMRGNCFVGNEVEFAAAVSHSDHRPVLSGNYGPSGGTICGFVAISSDSQESFECAEFDRPTCFVKNGFAVGYNDGPHWTAVVESSGVASQWAHCLGVFMALLATLLRVLG